MKKNIFLVLSILISYLLQTSVFTYFEIGGIRPNLVLMMTCMIGFLMGRRTGLIAGFFAGLLVDIMAGGIVGFSALAFMYLGFFNGLFSKDYVKEELFLPLGLVMASNIIYEALTYVFYFLLFNRLDFPYYFRRIIIPETIYTALVTLVSYVFVYFIIRKIEQKKEKVKK